VTADSRRRFADVVRAEPIDLGLACLLVGGEVDARLEVDEGLAALDDLAAAVRPAVPLFASPVVVADGLRSVLSGFTGSGDDYGDVRSSLLHEVLRRRRGLPLLLSVVWVEVAARLEVPAWPVALPGHVVVGLGDPDDEHVLVDPFGGGRTLDRDDVDAMVQLATGAPTVPAHLRPVPASDLLLRLLTNVRVLTTKLPPSLDAARTRLWAVELSLLLPRHPVGLRRERGELLVRLGDHAGGASELEDYALVVEDDDGAAAETARREARQARARLN
jgi:regulator of sirC expression with transglutaminase-like and TPR domain